MFDITIISPLCISPALKKNSDFIPIIVLIQQLKRKNNRSPQDRSRVISRNVKNLKYIPDMEIDRRCYKHLRKPALQMVYQEGRMRKKQWPV